MLAMEEHVETQAEMAWMKADKFYKLHPHVAPNPGPKELGSKAVAAHRAKLHRSSVEDNPTSEEDDLNNVDIANVCDV
eukprot:jgi/Pico_ML_1/54563/g4895.t1